MFVFNKSNNKAFAIIATGLNFIGFVIILLDACFYWNIRAFAMTPRMLIVKIIGIVFMVVGTTVFAVSLDENRYETVRKFLMVNICAYSIIPSMIVYFLDLPYLWPIIIYFFIVILFEVFLSVTKK